MKLKTATWYTATPITSGGTAIYLQSFRSSTRKGLNELLRLLDRDEYSYIIVKHEVRYYNDRSFAMMGSVANGAEAWDIEQALYASEEWKNVTLYKDC